MADGWVLWVLLVGLGLGAAAAWVLSAHLAREEDDIGSDERRDEAAWISAAIERDGGIAPETLVEEVLELHQLYLRTPGAAPEEMMPPTPAGPTGVVPPTGPGTPPPSPPARVAPPARVSPPPGDRPPPGNAPPTRR